MAVRFILALTVTVLGDALAVGAVLAAFAASVWGLIAQGTLFWVALLGSAVIVWVASWLLAVWLKPGRRWRDAVFQRAGFGPAPSRSGRPNPEGRAIGYSVTIAALVTAILAPPMILLLAPLIAQSLAATATLILGIELLLGGPILLTIGALAYRRASTEFGVGRSCP